MTLSVIYPHVGGNYLRQTASLNQHMRISILLFQILILLPLTSISQTKTKSGFREDSLREELRRTTIRLEAYKEQAERLEYLLAAKELALRSADIRDSAVQALITVQAYRFNLEHEGAPADIDIYRALHKALSRFHDPMIKTLPQQFDETDEAIKARMTAMAKIADQLCSVTERNLTPDEWREFYLNDLPYQSTCPIKQRPDR
jgi:hypothetical protein